MSIKINLYIFLFVILFFLTSQFELYALIMLFALLHEFGHLICGIILGFQVKSLNVMPLGFSVEFYTNIDEYNIKIKKSNLLTLKKLLIEKTTFYYVNCLNRNCSLKWTRYIM